MTLSVSYLFQDWNANPANIKSRIILVVFRLASSLRQARGWRYNPLTLAVGIGYRLVVEWVLGVELPWKTQVGPRLQIFHGFGIVVNDGAKIGADVVIRHGVTIGSKSHGGGAPIIEDGVEIGCGAAILGPVVVGARSVVGANSVVAKDVPAGSVVAGNPAVVVHGVKGG